MIHARIAVAQVWQCRRRMTSPLEPISPSNARPTTVGDIVFRVVLILLLLPVIGTVLMVFAPLVLSLVGVDGY